MSRRHITKQLKLLAEIRELRARIEKNSASKTVDLVKEALELLRRRHREIEEEFIGQQTATKAAKLQLLEMGRHRLHVDEAMGEERLFQAKKELMACQENHRQAILEEKGKERLHEHEVSVWRAEMQLLEQKLLDDIVSSRHRATDS